MSALMVGVVSFFLFQRFVVVPYQTRVNELETQKARKERQLRRIRTILASRNEIEAEYARRFNSRTSTHPFPAEMGTFLKSIVKRAREKNVRILDIRPNPTFDRTALVSGPSAPSAELRGQSAPHRGDGPSASFITESTWPRLASLLMALEDQRVIVEKITLTRSTQSPQDIKAQIQLSQE
jgi:hypothetical protein